MFYGLLSRTPSLLQTAEKFFLVKLSEAPLGISLKIAVHADPTTYTHKYGWGVDTTSFTATRTEYSCSVESVIALTQHHPARLFFTRSSSPRALLSLQHDGACAQEWNSQNNGNWDEMREKYAPNAASSSLFGNDLFIQVTHTRSPEVSSWFTVINPCMFVKGTATNVLHGLDFQIPHLFRKDVQGHGQPTLGIVFLRGRRR